MSTAASGSGTSVTPVLRTNNVSLSKWVNEPFPPWNDILTAHEVARLTRRHRWILSTLMLVGRFPKKQRFRGRRIGWLRADVVGWLAKNQRASRGLSERPYPSCSTIRLQKCLALEHTAPCAPIHRARRRASKQPRLPKHAPPGGRFDE